MKYRGVALMSSVFDTGSATITTFRWSCWKAVENVWPADVVAPWRTVSSFVRNVLIALATSAAAALRSLYTSKKRCSVSDASSLAISPRIISRSLSDPATMSELVRSSTEICRSMSAAPGATLPSTVRSGRVWSALACPPPSPPCPPTPPTAAAAGRLAGEELAEQVGGQGRVGRP